MVFDQKTTRYDRTELGLSGHEVGLFAQNKQLRGERTTLNDQTYTVKKKSKDFILEHVLKSVQYSNWIITSLVVLTYKPFLIAS